MPKPVSHILIPIAAILVVGVLVFRGGFDAPFIQDDYASIKENPEIEKLWPPSEAFATPEKASVAGRPIVALTLAINYAIGGREPFGYHVFNLAVHLLNALLIFAIVKRSLLLLPSAASAGATLMARWGANPTWPALGIALIWMAHPLQTEAVVWVIQRTELLVVFFYLATLHFAMLGWSGGRFRAMWFSLAAISCALGMGSKEVMVSSPLFVLLYDRTMVSRSFSAAIRRHWPLYAGLAASWLVLAAIVVNSPRGGSAGFDLSVSALEYLRTQGQVIVFYLRLCLWPWPLAITHDWPIAQSWGETILPGLFITALLATTMWLIVRRHPLGLAGALFFLVMGPTSSIIPIVTEVAAERRMYLPLAAVLVTGFAAADLILRKVKSKSVRGFTGAIGALAILIILSAVSVRRISDYHTEESIWRANYAVVPDGHQSNAGLGFALCNLNRFDEAIPFLERAVELQPDDVFSRQNLGLAYARTGHYHEAIRHYREALRRRPDVPESHHNIGAALGQIGELEEAVHHLREADRLRPDHPPTLANLASILIRDPLSAVFDSARALQYARRASTLTGDENAAILQILARAYAADGQYDAAARVADRARQRAETTGQDALAAELASLVEQYRARAGEG